MRTTIRIGCHVTFAAVVIIAATNRTEAQSRVISRTVEASSAEPLDAPEAFSVADFDPVLHQREGGDVDQLCILTLR